MAYARIMQMVHALMGINVNSHTPKNRLKRGRMMKKEEKEKRKHHPKEKPKAEDKEILLQHPFSHHPHPSPNQVAEQKQNQTTQNQNKHPIHRVNHQDLRVLNLVQEAHQTARVGPQPKGQVTD